MDVVKKIESVGSRNGQTRAKVTVSDCGCWTPEKKE